MVCNNCGSDNEKDSLYCYKCGSRLCKEKDNSIKKSNSFSIIISLVVYGSLAFILFKMIMALVEVYEYRKSIGL